MASCRCPVVGGLKDESSTNKVEGGGIPRGAAELISLNADDEQANEWSMEVKPGSAKSILAPYVV